MLSPWLQINHNNKSHWINLSKINLIQITIREVVVVVVVVYLFTNITSKYTHTEKLKTRLQSTIMSIYR